MLRRNSTGLNVAFIVALFPAWVVADTSHVPGDYATIQDCIDAAFDGDECVVGPGVYDENINFSGKAITVQSSDGPTGTIIDGGGATVVTCGSGEGRDTVLRGFTIRGGASSLTSFGGGMRNHNGSSPTVLDCIFEGNVSAVDGGSDGGGMFNTTNSSPLVIACTFRNNTAVGPNAQGGGMLNASGSNPELVDCLFDGNHAELEGGAIFNFASSPIIRNCTFVQNTAVARGGGIASSSGGTGAHPTIVNCILWGNSAGLGGESDQIYDESGSTSVMTYSCIQGCATFCDSPADANIGADPQFVDIDGPDGIPGNEDDNLRLSSGSSCIDAGDNDGVPSGVTTDLDGIPRFLDDPDTDPDTGNGTPPIVDMGAYEFTPCGDAIVGHEEACDDGFTHDCGTCNATCTGAGTGSTCGDGVECPETEACDDGANNGTGEGFCLSDCSGIQTCGDASTEGTEACDDENVSDCDGCRGDCSAVETGCGDGFVCGAEVCDDGNNGGGDGCSGTCNNECGDGTCDHDDSDLAAYVESNASCPADCFCGDGLLDTSEVCDDGNNVDCDGCSSNCEYEVRTPLPADPPNDRLKNRYISLRPNNPCLPIKLKITLTNSLPHPGLVGASWWVRAPIGVVPGQFPKPLVGPGECVALLGPENMAAEIDWDAAGCQVLHVTGCPIEPTSEYDIRAVNGTTESPPLSLNTTLRPGVKWWCDTVGFFDGSEWTEPNLTTNIDDAVAAIKTWQGGQIVAPVENVAHLSVCDVEPGDINTVVNFGDVFTIILAFQGEEYPFGPAEPNGNCP